MREDEKKFENDYKEYEELVKNLSGGLVETNKAEFLKFAAFTQVVINPILEEFAKNVTEQQKRKEKMRRDNTMRLGC